MAKKRGLTIITIFVLALISADLYFFKKNENSYFTLSGMAIKEVPEIFFGLEINFIMLALIVSVIFIILIIFLLYKKVLRNKENKITKNDYQIIKYKKTKAGTDFDILYNLLKDKKSMRIGTVSHIFNISKEKSLEWARILENHNLVMIEYPTFSDPIIKIDNKESEEKLEITSEKNIEKENKKEEIKNNGKAKNADSKKPKEKPVSKKTHRKK